MFLQKISISLILCTVLGLISATFVQFSVASAQEISPEEKFCSINFDISARFKTPSASSLAVEDVFSEFIFLTNPTDFYVGGLRVAVVAYDKDAKPAYWSVLPRVYQLSPQETIEVSTVLDLSSVSAGDYQVKVHLFQGSEKDLLGVAIRDAESLPGFKITKTKPKNINASVVVSINGEDATNEPISLNNESEVAVEIETTNNREALLRSKMIGVITKGKIPLGGAVVGEASDSMVLIPGASKITEVKTPGIDYKELTVYAGLLTEGAMQPINTATIKTENEEMFVWPYISRIGIDAMQLGQDSKIIACVENVSQDRDSSYGAPLAIDFSLSSRDEVLASERIFKLEPGGTNTFIFSPKQAVKDFTVSATLFHYVASISSKPLSAYENREEHIKDNFYEVAKTSFDLICIDREKCGEVVSGPDAPEQGGTERNNFWFYAGIVIASCLLMYIILRRLPPEQSVKSKVAKKELK